MSTVESKRPICGILSVALPPLGLLIAYLGSLLVTTPPRGVVIAIVILSLSGSLTGFALAVAGLIRRERLRWLPVIGLILSICIGFSHFAA
jgi:hypothetical protein